MIRRPAPNSNVQIICLASAVVIVLSIFLCFRYAFHVQPLIRWNPDSAVTEAKQDIKRSKIKIYLHGSIASSPVGVERNQMNIIQSLPTEDAGVGCIVEDPYLRQMQGEYAARYNRFIVQYLQNKPH